MTPHEIYHYVRKLSHKELVLHGSPHLLDVIEPRKATEGSGTESKNRLGIYATVVMHEAVIKAVVHGDMGWQIGRDDYVHVHGGLLTLGNGYLYVLPQKPFVQLPNKLWYIAHEPVKPVERIDLTPKILTMFPEIILPSYMTEDTTPAT